MLGMMNNSKSSIGYSRFRKSRWLFNGLMICCFVFVILFWGYLLCWLDNNKIKDDEVQMLHMENMMLRETILRQYRYCTKIEDWKLFDGDREFYLSSLLDEDYWLVICFSELQCSSCVDFVLNELAIIHEEVPKCKILAIASFRHERSYLEFIKNRSLPFEVYCTTDDLLQKDEFEAVPLLFMLNKELDMKNIFYPIKEIPSLLRQYINVITKYL